MKTREPQGESDAALGATVSGSCKMKDGATDDGVGGTREQPSGSSSMSIRGQPPENSDSHGVGGGRHQRTARRPAPGSRAREAEGSDVGELGWRWKELE